jgi:protein TonB
VFVIEANPQGIFEQAAMDAAKKFKYKPRVVNGEPAEVSGVQNRITFQIDG